MAMAFCRSALLMKELAERIGRLDDAKRMDCWHAEVAQAINKHAWDGKWYICAFDDDGKPIGADQNEQGKIFLNMQSWAQLGRVVSDERWALALESVDKHLNTGWGYRLQWPTYIKPESNVGRLSYLQPGICENGSVYTHGNAFLMLALLERGLADKALDVWRQINPDNNDRPLSCQTNVFINGYWGPDHLVKPGFAELPWLTGSAGWMFMCIVEYVFGLRRTYDGIVLNPCMPSAWKNASIKRIFRGTTYNITINNLQGKQAAPVKQLTIDGIVSDSNKALPIDGQSHDIVISI
jgi:cellobiose phosphorylase